MELLAASLVLLFAVGVASWALVAHRGGLHFAGPHSPASASPRTFGSTNAPQSPQTKGLYDQDEAERDDVERDIWGDPISPPELTEQDGETTDQDEVVIEWARSVPTEHDLWGDEVVAERRDEAEMEPRVQPVDDDVDIWGDATSRVTSNNSR
jgi:hypothetical protein